MYSYSVHQILSRCYTHRYTLVKSIYSFTSKNTGFIIIILSLLPEHTWVNTLSAYQVSWNAPLAGCSNRLWAPDSVLSMRLQWLQWLSAYQLSCNFALKLLEKLCRTCCRLNWLDEIMRVYIAEQCAYKAAYFYYYSVINITDPCYCRTSTTLIAMSTALTQLVSVLSGSNYQAWVREMTSFFMAQDLWVIITGNLSEPTKVASTDKDEIAKYNEELKDYKSQITRSWQRQMVGPFL